MGRRAGVDAGTDPSAMRRRPVRIHPLHRGVALRGPPRSKPQLDPTLRYGWGNSAPQDSAAPPRSTTLTLVVGTRKVWQGDVSGELSAWGRWCALAVAELWDCPRVVERYLVTGHRRLRFKAHKRAEHQWYTTAPQHPGATAAAIEAATHATALPHIDVACAAARACRAAIRAMARPGAQHEAYARLRAMILRRALPEDLWPLIGQAEAHSTEGALDVDPRVLSDALLQLR